MVRPVAWRRSIGGAFAGLGVITSLSACASADRLAAASDVHALMVAVRDDDRASFAAHVDKPALEARMQSVLVERARAAALPPAWTAAGVLASGPLSRWAGETLIRPEVFRAVADSYGYRPDTPLPGTLALATVLRPLPGGRICAVRERGAGDCLLVFAREGGVWKLADFSTAALKIGRPRP